MRLRSNAAQAGCMDGRMQWDFCHGLLAVSCERRNISAIMVVRPFDGCRLRPAWRIPGQLTLERVAPSGNEGARAKARVAAENASGLRHVAAQDARAFCGDQIGSSGWTRTNNPPVNSLTLVLYLAGSSVPWLGPNDAGTRHSTADCSQIVHGCVVSLLPGATGHGARTGSAAVPCSVPSSPATLKTQLIQRQPWPTRRATKDAVADYIEGSYNPY